MRRSPPPLQPVAAAALCPAAGSDDPSVRRARLGDESAAVTGTINVFAAASLNEAFTTLGKQFEAANPGTKVMFNFGPSSGLAEQISQGAPADVFASASTKDHGRGGDRR